MTNDPASVIIVTTKLPDRAGAEALARHLVQQRLAACVNVMAACSSTYRWRDKLENASEIPVLIKSTLARYEALESAIRRLHPYELPEIHYVHADGGAAAYLQWVRQETMI